MRKPDPFPSTTISVDNVNRNRDHGHNQSHNHNNSKSNSNSGSKKLKKGLWSPEEDEKLMHYMVTNGQGCWSDVAKNAGLQRCGKSCRLRWINYLRPDLKRGAFSPQEEDLIIRLHSLLGNRWSQIAARLPGRTDNEIKNFWNSTIKKRLKNMSTNIINLSSSPDSSSSSSCSSSLELKDIIGSFMSLQEQGFINTSSPSPLLSSKSLNHIFTNNNPLPMLVDHPGSNQLCSKDTIDPCGDGLCGVNTRVEGEFYFPPLKNVGCEESDWHKADFTTDGFVNNLDDSNKVEETYGAGSLWNGAEGFRMEEWDLEELMNIEGPSLFFNL